MNTRRVTSRSLIGASLLVLAACGKDSTAPPPPAVASVAVAPTATSVTVGDAVRLVATVKDGSGHVLTDRIVTWASSNVAVATVSATGLVTGVRADAQPTTITATSDGVHGSAAVTVIAAAASISITVVPPTARLLPGASQDLTATVVNDPTNSGVTWSITGCAGGSAGCGSLTNITSSTATYTAPATVPPAPVGVTATSVADPTKSFSATVATTIMSGGGQIAFFTLRGGVYQIDVMDADGSGVIELTAVDNPFWLYSAEPVWSPDGSKIAFYDTDIYVMNADGSGRRNLTKSPAWDHRPAWSPDGTKILFLSMHCQVSGNLVTCDNAQIYVMNADGSGVIQLTQNPADAWEPAWSPSGAKILFSSRRDENWEVYAMNADGAGQANLTTNPAQDQEPAWSPDGSHIAFTSTRDGTTDIYVMNADGSSPVRLTTGGGMQLSWSPDGTKIAFVGVGGLSVINVDGSDLRSLTNNASHPKWSPDGTKIAFTSYRDGNWEIYVINPDGSGLRNLTNDPATDMGPAWRPRLP